jgi:hypothetical protein
MQYKNVANLGKDLEENFAQDVTIILDENTFRKITKNLKTIETKEYVKPTVKCIFR